MIASVLSRRFILPALAVMTVGAMGVPGAFAQEAPPPAVPLVADEAQRLEISRKLHEIRPASLQVEAALGQVARGLSEADRQSFISRMMAAIDSQRIEDVSTAAMAQIFTLTELQRMYEYFSAPEARGISDKMSIYQGAIQPEIMKMLDKAMLEMRTGGGATAAPSSSAPVRAPASAPAPAPAVSAPVSPAPGASGGGGASGPGGDFR